MPQQSTKGIPENLKPLAKQGLRVRFNGGWLNDSEQDRFIAEWIDKTPNSWAVMKHLLYQILQGRGYTYEATASPDEYPDEIEIGEAGKALLSFDD